MLRLKVLQDSKVNVARLLHGHAVNTAQVKYLQTSAAVLQSAQPESKGVTGQAPKPSSGAPKPATKPAPTTSYSTVKPNENQKKSKAGAFFKSISLTVITIGGIAGYSLYDDQFTKNMNQYVPGYETAIKQLHGAVDGYLPKLPERKSVPSSGPSSRDSTSQLVMMPLPPSSRVPLEKPLGKPDEKLTPKTDIKSVPKAQEPKTDKPKAVETPKDAIVKAKSEPQVVTKKPTNEPAVKPAKPAEKPTEKPVEKPTEKPADKPAEKLIEKSVDKPIVAAKLADSTKATTDNATAVEKSSEKSVQKTEDTKQAVETDATFAEFEEKVKSSLQSASRAVDVALLAQSEAQVAIEAHTHTLKAALENTGFDPRVMNDFWSKEVHAGQRRTEAVSEAKRALQLAQIALGELDSQLRIDEMAQPDKAQRAGRSALYANAKADGTRLRAELERANESVTEAMRVFSAFHDVETRMLEARLTLERDLRTILPNMKFDRDLLPVSDNNASSVQLNPAELSALISYVLSRTAHLQATIARQSATHREELVAAMRRERDTALRSSNAEAYEELERLRRAHSEEIGALEARLRAQQEGELRTQSERQLTVFVDSLRRRLAEQSAALTAKFNAKIDEQRVVTRREAEGRLAAADAHVRAIESAVSQRAAAVASVCVAHDLFIACTALDTALKQARDNVPLNSLVERIASVVDDSSSTLNRYVSDRANESVGSEVRVLLTSMRSAVGSVPSLARSRGVLSEASLIDNFEQLQGRARRVALVRETGGSIFDYVVSYIESALTLRTTRMLGPDHEFGSVRNELNAYTALDNAHYHLRHGDIELAVRFVNQLRGQARVVFADWLNEARLHLETRQSARLLTAIAESMHLKTVD